MQGKERIAKLQWQSWLVLALVCASVLLRVATGTLRAGWGRNAQTALGISAAFALMVWLARAATPAAALAGGLCTAALTLGFGGMTGWYHSAVPALVALFLLTFAATRFGRGKKKQLGLDESKTGRNAAQVAANLGVAAALSHPMASSLYAVAVVGAVAEATADTMASELGEVMGGFPFMITTLRRVAPGTDGAISMAGTLAGAAGAGIVVMVAVATLGISNEGGVCAGLGAIAGLFIDSLLGATAERRGWLNNDAVNFLSTAAAAIIAIAIFMLG